MFKQIGSLLAKLDTNTLIDFAEDEMIKWDVERGWVHDWDDFHCICFSDSSTDNRLTVDDYYDGSLPNVAHSCAMLMLPYSLNDEEDGNEIKMSYDVSTEVVVTSGNVDKEENGLFLYLINNVVSNEDVIILIRKLFDIYGLSYDDLKIQFI
jgi:hypothetical protein